MGTWGPGAFENDHEMDLLSIETVRWTTALREQLEVQDTSWEDVEGPPDVAGPPQPQRRRFRERDRGRGRTRSHDQRARILVDMNLSPLWATFLVDHGFEAVHWSSVGDAVRMP